MSFVRALVRAAPAVVARSAPAARASVASFHRSAAAAPAAAASTFRRCMSSAAFVAAEPVKTTTKIAGLDVIPNGRDVFIGLQREILASLAKYNADLGSEPKYNEHVRKVAEHRLKIAEDHEDLAIIEGKLFAQIEELVEMAEDELDLTVMMNEEVKPWEPMSAAEQAEFDSMKQPNFGEDPAVFASGLPAELTAEEKAENQKFWDEMDKEILERMSQEPNQGRVEKETLAKYKK